MAALSRSRGDVMTRYRDVAVAALASVDHHQAVAFVARVLGPLANDDEATYRVAMTLAVYLQENRSPARAAQRLTVHPNTVSYRVNQAESILGRSVDADAFEVSVALDLLPLLPGLSARFLTRTRLRAARGRLIRGSPLRCAQRQRQRHRLT